MFPPPLSLEKTHFLAHTRFRHGKSWYDIRKHIRRTCQESKNVLQIFFFSRRKALIDLLARFTHDQNEEYVSITESIHVPLSDRFFEARKQDKTTA